MSDPAKSSPTFSRSRFLNTLREMEDAVESLQAAFNEDGGAGFTGLEVTFEMGRVIDAWHQFQTDMDAFDPATYDREMKEAGER